MREIKYKYIFKHSKDKDIQTEVFGIDKIEKYPLYHHKTISDYLEDDGYKCVDKVQYTGLKDKNGVEIYVGDIVKHHVHLVNEPIEKQIMFWEGSFIAKPIGRNYEGNQSYMSLVNFAPIRTMEVIGNTYENKELL